MMVMCEFDHRRNSATIDKPLDFECMNHFGINMKLLDLYCKAGGAGMGYHRAGFEVVGIDIEPQPHYPFEFIQADALTFPLNGFDVIHASPPCQRYSNGAKKWGTQDLHPDLIAPTRKLLEASGKPYIIENIESTHDQLIDPIMLCGTMFDLGVFRHRLFESPWLHEEIQLFHFRHVGRVGDGKYHTVTGHAGGSSKRDGWKGGSTADWRIAMGIDWMNGSELAEAIPPTYTEWIGLRIKEAILKGQL